MKNKLHAKSEKVVLPRLETETFKNKFLKRGNRTDELKWYKAFSKEFSKGKIQKKNRMKLSYKKSKAVLSDLLSPLLLAFHGLILFSLKFILSLSNFIYLTHIHRTS